MKKKKSLVFLSLLVAIFVLGVGYAAVTGVPLNITGTATVEGSTLNVKFTGSATGYAYETGATVTPEATANTTTGTLTITGLQKVNDEVKAVYVVKNNETELNAKLTEVSATSDKTEFFEITTNIDSSTATVLAPGQSTNLEVTVKLIKLPLATADSTANITVSISAEADYSTP